MARTSTSLSSGAPSSVANHKVLASLPFFETYIEPIFKLLNISLVQVCSSRFCLQPRVRGKFERCVPPSLLRSRLRDEVNNPQSSSTQWIPLHLSFAQLLTLRLNMVVSVLSNQFALVVFCRTFCGALFFPTIATFLGSTLFEEVMTFPLPEEVVYNSLNNALVEITLSYVLSGCIVHHALVLNCNDCRCSHR